jgi:hypothetical protein
MGAQSTGAQNRPTWRLSPGADPAVGGLETAEVGDEVWVRNSNQPDIIQRFGRREWFAMVRSLRDGEELVP